MKKERTPDHFKNRFAKEYLAYLIEKLSLRNLINTAITAPKTINGKTYQKCIKIDYCGIAANTLLATNLARPEIAGDTFDLRVKIFKKFIELCNSDNLRSLNENKKEGGIYLKVRFCFSYLYSDYPICLMKAEQKGVWENLTDNPINNFYINPPLSRDEFEGSGIYLSQKESLRKIVDIITDNHDLIILGDVEKKANTIQVRFSPLPSSLCTLFINDEAFFDPYIYAKFQNNPQLSCEYPINVLNARTNKIGFENIEKNFNYLWKHDLTLFCGDATNFTPRNKSGLTVLRPPYDDNGSLIIKWEHKKKRILEKQKEILRGKNIKFEIDNDLIEKWETNLDNKFRVCTRKILERVVDHDKQTDPVTPTTITVGMIGQKFHFKIVFQNNVNVCELKDNKGTLLYCFLAHYAYAKVRSTKNKEILPTLYEKGKYQKVGLYDQLKRQLKSNTINAADGQQLFDMLFDTTKGLSLKIPKENIRIDEKNIAEISEATLTGKDGITEIRCLQDLFTPG